VPTCPVFAGQVTFKYYQIIHFALAKNVFLIYDNFYCLKLIIVHPYSMNIDNDEATHYRDSFVEAMNDIED